MDAEKQMTSFGEYLLSNERKKRVKVTTSNMVPYKHRKASVFHADFENWKEKEAVNERK